MKYYAYYPGCSSEATAAGLGFSAHAIAKPLDIELKELEEEKKKLAQEIEAQRAQFTSKAKAIIEAMKGKPAGEIKAKLAEAGIPSQIADELLGEAKAAATAAAAGAAAPAGAKGPAPGAGAKPGGATAAPAGAKPEPAKKEYGKK